MKKFKNYLIVLTALVVIGSIAKADVTSDPNDLIALRASFQSDIPKHEEKLDRAAKMVFLDAPINTPVSRAQCIVIRKQVEKNYPFSPFKFVFHDGDFTSPVCGDEGGAAVLRVRQIFFGRVNLKNQFGLPIAFGLKTVGNGTDGGAVARTVYLDSQYRIVEIDGAATFRDRIVEFDVDSLDAKGNYYSTHYNNENSTEPWIISRNVFASADGTVPGSYRMVRHRTNQKGPEIVKMTIYRKANKDWTGFHLVPPFASPTGGFYSYGDKLEWTAANREEVEVVTVKDQEVCATGFTLKNDRYLYFHGPASQNDVGGCSNNW